MRRTLGLGALGLLFALTLVSCGDDDSGDKAADDSSSDTTAAENNPTTAGADELEDVVVVDGPEADVKVLDNSFNDQNIQVAPGTKVVWTNHGRQDHDVVPADGDGFGVEPSGFGPDAVYEFTFEQPGTYRYYCSLHGTATAGMVGAVVVKEEEQGS
jgi:plastocyanin